MFDTSSSMPSALAAMRCVRCDTAGGRGSRKQLARRRGCAKARLCAITAAPRTGCGAADTVGRARTLGAANMIFWARATTWTLSGRAASRARATQSAVCTAPLPSRRVLRAGGSGAIYRGAAYAVSALLSRVGRGRYRFRPELGLSLLEHPRVLVVPVHTLLHALVRVALQPRGHGEVHGGGARDVRLPVQRLRTSSDHAPSGAATSPRLGCLPARLKLRRDTTPNAPLVKHSVTDVSSPSPRPRGAGA
jgi:hypothetical protein